MFERRIVTQNSNEHLLDLADKGFNNLQQNIEEKIQTQRARVKQLIQQKGDVIVGEVKLSQIFGGMRGVNALVTDVSYVDPVKGTIIRGLSIPELLEKLPKTEGANYPLAGGLYYLLLTGELPTLQDAILVENEWYLRSEVPGYVFDILHAMPENTHPMTLFSQAILAMQNESVFIKEYQAGMQRSDYWKATLEDSLNLTAKLPAIAAYIYNLKYRNSVYIPPSPELDWSANFAYMIGKYYDTGYQELTRLFFILHADQESGNVSAHTAHLVGSALSDVYYSCSAGMNGLAGPLHGLANQECLRWLLELRNNFDHFPTREDVKKFAWDTLNSGKVIPGYGHAVLRETDSRFTAQNEFGKNYLPEDPLFQLANLVYEVVPGVLKELGKAKNPWPNVDAISGTLQYHFGIHEMGFYTVLFGVSRTMGLTAQAVWARGLGLALERPKSITTSMLEEIAYGNENSTEGGNL